MLSDAEQRAVYDEQGTVDEEGEALRAERDWQEYWRLLFKKVSTALLRAGTLSAFCCLPFVLRTNGLTQVCALLASDHRQRYSRL